MFRPTFLPALLLLGVVSLLACRRAPETKSEAVKRCTADADCGSGSACAAGACVPAFNITGAPASAAPEATPAASAAPAPVASTSAAPAPRPAGSEDARQREQRAQELARQLEGMKMDAIGARATPEPQLDGQVVSSAPKTEVKVTTAQGDVALGAVSVTRGTLAGADRRAASLRPGLKRCYARGLESDPSIQGAIAFSVQIGQDGAPTHVAATPSGNLGSTVIACAKARILAAQFDPPGGSGGAAVSFRATFALR